MKRVTVVHMPVVRAILKGFQTNKNHSSLKPGPRLWIRLLNSLLSYARKSWCLQIIWHWERSHLIWHSDWPNFGFVCIFWLFRGAKMLQIWCRCGHRRCRGAEWPLSITTIKIQMYPIMNQYILYMYISIVTYVCIAKRVFVSGTSVDV